MRTIIERDFDTGGARLTRRIGDGHGDGERTRFIAVDVSEVDGLGGRGRFRRNRVHLEHDVGHGDSLGQIGVRRDVHRCSGAHWSLGAQLDLVIAIDRFGWWRTVGEASVIFEFGGGSVLTGSITVAQVPMRTVIAVGLVGIEAHPGPGVTVGVGVLGPLVFRRARRFFGGCRRIAEIRVSRNVGDRRHDRSVLAVPTSIAAVAPFDTAGVREQVTFLGCLIESDTTFFVAIVEHGLGRSKVGGVDLGDVRCASRDGHGLTIGITQAIDRRAAGNAPIEQDPTLFLLTVRVIGRAGG